MRIDFIGEFYVIVAFDTDMTITDVPDALPTWLLVVVIGEDLH